MISRNNSIYFKMSRKLTEIVEIDSFMSSVPRVRNRDEMKKYEEAEEDCFILDFDPYDDDDADLDFSKISVSEKNADVDLLLLAQKGQVACRDFPHARHLCGRFPFKATPSKSHCKFCYCYVCDLPAPCEMWVGNYYHCFAFDNERWNAERKLMREADKLPKQVAVARGDFPENLQQLATQKHPRHECKTFPFKTTPCKSHCKFCYCYVCDLPAPCKMWVGNYYHCFAFDNERWNTKRELARQATA